MKITSILQLITIIALLSSCVSSKKYNELEAKYQKSNIEVQGVENRIDALKVSNENLERQLKNAERENANLKKEIYEREGLKRQEMQTLQKKYNDLNSAYQQLLTNSTQEANTNRQLLEQQNAQLAQLNGNTKNPSNTFNNNNQTPFNGNTQANNQTPFHGNTQTPFNSNGQVYTQQNSSNQNHQSLANKNFSNTPLISSNIDNTNYSGTGNQSTLLNLQNQLAQVLQDFRQDEARLELKNGNLYLNFSDQVLFNNAQYNLSSRATQALKNISTILKTNPRINISLVSEDTRADETPDGLKKVESLGSFLQKRRTKLLST